MKNDAFSYLTIGSAILLIILVLVQTRGASLGAGFGSSGEIHTTRRGVDKSLHQITIVVAVAFILSILLSVLQGK
jgi:preprotein translocase subunit SecG